MDVTPPPPGLDYYKKTDGVEVVIVEKKYIMIVIKYFYSVGNLTDKKNIVGDFWLSIPEGIKLGLLKLDGEPFTEEEIR